MFLSDFFTILYFIIASIAFYFILTCVLDKKHCRNPEDVFILPTKGFISPFMMLAESRYKIFLQSFISPRNPYLYIIIGIIVGCGVITYRRYKRNNKEEPREEPRAEDNVLINQPNNQLTDDQES